MKDLVLLKITFVFSPNYFLINILEEEDFELIVHSRVKVKFK